MSRIELDDGRYLCGIFSDKLNTAISETDLEGQRLDSKLLEIKTKVVEQNKCPYRTDYGMPLKNSTVQMRLVYPYCKCKTKPLYCERGLYQRIIKPALTNLINAII